MDRRTRARELAMQAIFQLEAQAGESMKVLERFLSEYAEDDLVKTQAREWIKDAWFHVQETDQMIRQAAAKWQLSRMSAVDLSILRLCVYQLAYCPKIPPKVVINEGIELAKKYSSQPSSRFVNGVLDAVMKNIAASKQKTE